MYGSHNAIGLGGNRGKFALYLSDNLTRGTSTPVESYNNNKLSKRS